MFSVKEPVDFNGENEVDGGVKSLVLEAVRKELESSYGPDVNRMEGRHPDGEHAIAVICQKGHVTRNDGPQTGPLGYCQKCGAENIDECHHCRALIPGVENFRDTSRFVAPQFCAKCGKPYPWMVDRLQTARRLLDQDKKLSLEERETLWDDLQYVMSDPRADLVPAKKKLIQIGLEKATPAIREFVLDLMAKFAAEMSKP